MLKFHTADGRVTILPLDKIKYIQEHLEGGAIIYTSMLHHENEKPLSFRAKETSNELLRLIDSRITASSTRRI